jgi:hypothetical protein
MVPNNNIKTKREKNLLRSERIYKIIHVCFRKETKRLGYRKYNCKGYKYYYN